jgi:hypothetical protein
MRDHDSADYGEFIGHAFIMLTILVGVGSVWFWLGHGIYVLLFSR